MIYRKCIECGSIIRFNNCDSEAYKNYMECPKCGFKTKKEDNYFITFVDENMEEIKDDYMPIHVME